jgi:hypothetical protein
MAPLDVSENLFLILISDAAQRVEIVERRECLFVILSAKEEDVRFKVESKIRIAGSSILPASTKFLCFEAIRWFIRLRN